MITSQCIACERQYGKKAGHGQSGVSHGFCSKCLTKLLPSKRRRARLRAVVMDAVATFILFSSLLYVMYSAAEALP